MAKRPDHPGMDGVIVVAKPVGPTSHDVVALVRRLADTRRIGHGGTLDPFASGVLPLFLGRATRLVEYHLGDVKRYRATICFGASSTTDDLAGELTPSEGAAPDEAGVAAALAASLGEQEQVPPVYSAIQVEGRRAYSLAREGNPPELAPRRVVLETLDLVTWDDTDPARPIAVVDIVCSAGTYVRAIARDLGQRLGGAAYLGALERTASGPFRVDAAVSLDELRAAAAAGGPEGIRAMLLAADTGLEHLVSQTLTAAEVADAARGRFVRPASGIVAAGPDDPIRLIGPDGRIVGIATRQGRHLAPSKMLVSIDA